MTQDMTPILSLIARGMAAAIAMLQLKHACKLNQAINLDCEVEGEYLANKAKFEAIAKALRSRTMNASAADMEMALLHASQDNSFDSRGWTTLIEKLSASEVASDRKMAEALQVFA